MKPIVVVLAFAFACAAPMASIDGPLHPNVPGYRLDHGVIYGPAGPEYKLVVQTAAAGISAYEVHALDGELLVTISCSKEARTRASQDPRIEVECTTMFVTIDRGFTAGFPDRPVTNLIGVWIKMGALSGGKAELAGLEKFSAKTGIAIESIKAYATEMSAAMREHDCSACAASYRACQVDSTQPRSGLTVTTSCEARYEGCAQRIGTCGPISR